MLFLVVLVLNYLIKTVKNSKKKQKKKENKII